MEEIYLYLNHHVDIKNAVLLVGYHYSPDQLKVLLSQTHLEKLFITGSLSAHGEEKIKEEINHLRETNEVRLPTDISFAAPDSWNDEYQTDAVLFDGISNISEFRLVEKLKFRYLLGNVDENVVSSFDVWEKFRKQALHIYIKTKRPYKMEQILNWDKDESNDIELSVIFPVYKVEKYLNECLESVTAWNADYVEFLFVNDGSPDHSRDIILEWADKDSRIRLLDKENGGCASARQYGLDHSRGRYVGFIDPDDYTDQSMYPKLLAGAMTGSYDICFCGYNEYYESDRTVNPVMDDVFWPFTDGVTDPWIIHSMIAYARVAIWRGIYKKSMIDNAGIHFYTDLKRFDDLPFKVEVFAAAKAVYAIPEPLYYYRLQRPGQDVSADDNRLFVHFEIFKHLNQRIAGTKDPRLTDWLQLCKLQTHRYALITIQDKYLKEYLKKAKEDLDSTGTKAKSFEMIKSRLGKKAALYYAAIEAQSEKMIKMLNKK